MTRSQTLALLVVFVAILSYIAVDFLGPPLPRDPLFHSGTPGTALP